MKERGEEAGVGRVCRQQYRPGLGQDRASGEDCAGAQSQHNMKVFFQNSGKLTYRNNLVNYKNGLALAPGNKPGIDQKLCRTSGPVLNVHRDI